MQLFNNDLKKGGLMTQRHIKGKLEAIEKEKIGCIDCGSVKTRDRYKYQLLCREENDLREQLKYTKGV